MAMNPNGKVPLMVLPDGQALPESNAILAWLADGSPLAGGAWGGPQIQSSAPSPGSPWSSEWVQPSAAGSVSKSVQ